MRFAAAFELIDFPRRSGKAATRLEDMDSACARADFGLLKHGRHISPGGLPPTQGASDHSGTLDDVRRKRAGASLRASKLATSTEVSDTFGASISH